MLELAEMQIEVGHFFVRAEMERTARAYGRAHPIYQEYLGRSRECLQAFLEFNTRYPEQPYDIPPIAQTLVTALLMDADIVQALGDRHAADELRKEALELSRLHLGRDVTADTERLRAASLAGDGRFNEAIVALMNARDVILEKRDPLTLARIVIDLANILQWLGDNKRAKDEIEHAASIIAPFVADRPPTQRDILAGMVTSVASIEAGQGDPGHAKRSVELYRAYTEITFYRGLISKACEEWDEAERCFEQILPQYRALRTGEAIECQLANIKVRRREYREALDQLGRIALAFDRDDFRPMRGVLQRLQAECLFALGDSSAALQLVDESISDLTERHFVPEALWRSQRLRACIYAEKGEHKLAIQSFRDAVATVSELRRAPLGYRLDSTYLSDKKDLYSQAIAEALRTEEAVDCCRFIEGIKSRTLTAVLSIPRADSRGRMGLDLEFEDVTAQLDTLEYQAYREGWSAERRAGHRALLQKRTDLLERIRISDPRWRHLSVPLALDVDGALQTLSRRSQAALTLYYDPPVLVSVLLCDGEITVGHVSTAPDLPAKLADYAGNLRKPQPDPFKHDLSVEYAIGAEDLVPMSLLSRALAARSLVVIPHGPLHVVPWAALLYQGARLFERLPVGILPTLGTVRPTTGGSRPRLAALVGVSAYPALRNVDDLPSAREEIEAIRAVYAAADVPVQGPLMDEAGTEQAFWSLVHAVSGPGNVLHVSCHGTIVPNEPMSSGLLLADAKVDAAEVARAVFPFDEVVLSACSTGWRPTQVADVMLAADEILGIPAGFLEAGARSVLVSIPKAEGRAACTLTTHYHTQRAAGVQPLAAFQSAQRHMLQQGVSPGTWVGFALYGDT